MARGSHYRLAMDVARLVLVPFNLGMVMSIWLKIGWWLFAIGVGASGVVLVPAIYRLVGRIAGEPT